MTEQSSNSRRRPPRGRSLRASYAIAAVCVLVITALLVLGATAQRGLPGEEHYELSADFASASNLGNYAEVRIAGRRAGQVTDVALHAGTARVALQLYPEFSPLREGTTARIRLKGLLGAKFVELDPAAQGAPLRDGAVLPVSQTSSSVELFDVFEALDKPRREELQVALRALGTGFLGRGEQLNDAIKRFPAALHDLAATTRAINERSGAAERLVPSLDAAARALDPVREDLAVGWNPQARSFAPFADRRSDVQGTLVAAGPALDSLRSGLAETNPLLAQTARFARSARKLTGPAPETLRQTTALLEESRRPLQSARTLLERATHAVPPTLDLTDRIDPLIDPVVEALRGGKPLLAELDRRRCDYLGFVRNWRGMLAYGVPGGHPIGPENGLRVTLVGGKGTAQQVIGDLPVKTTDDIGAYPKDCALGQVRVPWEEWR